MRFLALVGALAILVALGASVYFFGGYYSVAANAEDPALVAAALIRVRSASIAKQATEAPPLAIDDPAVIQAGARAFATNACVNCHGGPGVKWAKFSEGLNPSPPDLKEVVGGLEPREIFWVVKNGIRMTGMPSFGAIGVTDRDIWSIAAFLKKLPGISDGDYQAWTAAVPGKG
jgi:mono/diheme cytochrome c family protein